MFADMKSLSWQSFVFTRRAFFTRVLSFDEGLQIGKAGYPEDTVLPNPGVDGAKRFGIELIHTMTPFAMLTNEVGATEQAQVFRNRRTGDGKRAGDLPRGLTSAAQEVEDCAAGRIG
jgi:hypothetical protein